MPPQQRKANLHGVDVQQTNLQGKWYTPVDARVKIAEQADPALIRRPDAGYTVISVQFIEIAERWAYHCLVEYPAGSGVIKPGTDFIDTKDPSGVAKAETSAIGRALGLHGIAIEESIASADEMSRVTATATAEDEDQPAPQPRQQPPQRPQAQQHAAPTPRPSAPAQTPSQREAAAPPASSTPRSAPAAPVTNWQTTDGCNPLADRAIRQRLSALNISSIADVETWLGRVKGAYTHYTRKAIEDELTTMEARAQAHNLREAFPADQQRGA